MRLLLPLLLIACSSAAFAQDPRNDPKSSQYVDWQRQAMDVERTHSAGIREAVPTAPKYGYPVTYWTKGLLRPYAGPPARPWLLYDAIEQRLYTRTAADLLEVVPTEGLREFSVGDSLLGSCRTYRRYLSARVENPTLRTAFFEVRYDAGRNALLRHQQVNLDPKSVAAIRKGSRMPPERNVYYIRSSDRNTLTPVALREATVLKGLGSAHGPALAAYVRSKKLKLNREGDVITLLAYLDTL